MPDRIERQVALKATLSRVWEALTDHVQFGAWFGAAIETPFVAGQPAHGRITHPGYEHLRWEATVQRIEPQRLFSFTWRPYAIDPAVDYSAELTTLVEFRLAADGDGTLLTVTESGFDGIPEGRRAEAFRMNESGWTEQMTNIARHVDGIG